MHIAQHLVVSLSFIFGTTVFAQDNATTSTPAVAPAPAPTPIPIPEEVSVPSQSLLRSVGTKDFSKPLFFDQVDKGVILPPMELEYEVGNEGASLRMGNLNLNSSTYFFALLPLGKAHRELPKVLTVEESQRTALVMVWPDQLIGSGRFEIISKTGNVLWKTDITDADLKKWTDTLEGWRKQLRHSTKDPKGFTGGIFSSQFASMDFDARSVFESSADSFRFCLTHEKGRNQSKLCSQRYGLKRVGNGFGLEKRPEPTSARVLVNNADAPLQGSPVVSADNPTFFYAQLSNGESYEFATLPNKLQLMDLADTKNPKVLRIVGYDTRPIGKSTIMNPDQYGSLTKMIGFESTIGDPRKFWAAVVPTDDPKIFLPGEGGGVFKQRFELSEIPRRQSRIYLSKHTPTGTYIDGIELEGRKQPSSEVTSNQNEVLSDRRDPSHFYWRFGAVKRGEINRSYLDVGFQGKHYQSYYEIYKGYPREFSARLSAVGATSGGMVFLGEVAYSQWFEDLLGWTNYYVSRQHWGVAAKYFKSMNELKVDTSGKTASLSAWNVDLKYRFTPGLWNRDETVGLLASYQNVTFDQLKAPMLGGGIFWARSMPKSIDELFNYVPLFRYPKWVDMEFIYYAQSMDSNVTLNSSMSLNFHGKVLWTNTWYGEAGFGIKRYAFLDTALNQKANLNTFYGTLGVGLNF